MSELNSGKQESGKLTPGSMSRRKLITTGLAATAGVAGLGVAARLAQKYGLIPPDHLCFPAAADQALVSA
jgi:hypothetical protein